jgi:hypothetical protein
MLPIKTERRKATTAKGGGDNNGFDSSFLGDMGHHRRARVLPV